MLKVTIHEIDEKFEVRVIREHSHATILTRDIRVDGAFDMLADAQARRAELLREEGDKA